MARLALRSRVWSLGLFALLLGLATFARARSLPPRSSGLEVAAVDPKGAGARAGLRPRDRILSVRRAAAPPANPRPFEAIVTSCSRFSGIEEEEAPRGPVSFEVRRGGTALRLDLPRGPWKIEARSAAAGPEARACAALARGSRALDARQWEPADAALAEAEAAARQTRDPLLLARIRERQGLSLGLHDKTPDRAEALVRSALRLRRRALPGSVTEARTLVTLGGLILRRDGEATSLYAAARRLFSRQAPESLDFAALLITQGRIEIDAGRREAGVRLATSGLALAHRLSGGGLEEAAAFNVLGSAALEAGDYAAAERFYRQTFVLQRRHDPMGQNTAGSLLNLGAVASHRGDIAGSESYTTAALHRFEAIAPGGRGVIICLDNLGVDAIERYDFARAEALFRRAYDLQSRTGDGPMTATLLSHLAWATAEDPKRLDEAEALIRQALAVSLRFSEARNSARIYRTLGDIRYDRKDFAGAQRAYEESLAIRRRRGLESSTDANVLYALALAVEERHGAPPRVEEILRRGLALAHHYAPGSKTEAKILDKLATLLRHQGREAEAGAAFAAALDALESQAGRLGGSDETRSRFERKAADFYADVIDFDLAQGRPAEALLTLERSRARRLLEMLAERDLLFDRDVPGGLLARQRRLDQEQAEARDELAGLDPSRDGARVEEIRQRFADLRAETAGLERRIAQTSPRYASLRQPRPLDLPAIRRALDPGTVWLSYCVTAEKTFLFVVQAEGDTPVGPAADDGLQVFTLPVGSEALAAEAAVFRSLLLRGRVHPEPDPALHDEERKLYDLLIAPAAATVAGSRRLLISADGPLQTLPFAALVLPGGSYLAEARPIHKALSATLFAEIRRGRSAGPPTDGRLAVFGEPSYPVAARDVRTLSSTAGAPPLLRYRRGLPPLPFARLEAAGLATLYGADAEVFLGPAATEGRLRALGALGQGPRYLHFASHALLDRRFPLDSALALSPGGGDDGLLQAWEIFEKVRIDADLVTLAACETGLGEDAGGEGLIGLTRAFQYAGARSVLASLWEVSDRSTALLMRRFYAALRAGSSKDEALRQAQLALLHGKNGAAHPYAWAAFELTGDWR